MDLKILMQLFLTTIRIRNHGMDLRIALKLPVEIMLWMSATKNAMFYYHAPLKEASLSITAAN